MDPTNTNHWQWGRQTGKTTRAAIACVLWTLYRHGPLESENGRCPKLLSVLLQTGNGPYQAARAQPRLNDILQTIRRNYSDAVQFETVGHQTFRIALAPELGPDHLPPDPYGTDGPGVARKAKRAATEATPAEPVPITLVPEGMAAADALAAVSR